MYASALVKDVYTAVVVVVYSSRGQMVMAQQQQPPLYPVCTTLCIIQQYQVPALPAAPGIIHRSAYYILRSIPGTVCVTHHAAVGDNAECHCYTHDGVLTHRLTHQWRETREEKRREERASRKYTQSGTALYRYRYA